MFGPYGRAQHGPPEGVAAEDHTRTPHVGTEVPQHTRNICPRAGDIVFMSEAVSHASMPWVGEGHRYALALRFKPQHRGLPDDGLDEAAILALALELRQLRASHGVAATKPLVERPLPITLSPPDPSQPLENAERCAERFLRTEPADTAVMRDSPPAALPQRPGTIGLTDEQRYLMDLNGYLHIKGCLSVDEIAAAREAVDEYVSFTCHPEDLPEGFSVDPFAHGFAFHKALEALAWHPKVAPALLELTDGKPKLSSGTLLCQDDSYGGGGLHCAREDHGWQSAHWQVAAGRCHCDNFVVFPYLDDVHEGDGGLVVVPGSHKCNFERPGQSRSELPPLFENDPQVRCAKSYSHLFPLNSATFHLGRPHNCGTRTRNGRQKGCRMDW